MLVFYWKFLSAIFRTIRPAIVILLYFLLGVLVLQYLITENSTVKFLSGNPVGKAVYSITSKCLPIPFFILIVLLKYSNIGNLLHSRNFSITHHSQCD